MIAYGALKAAVAHMAQSMGDGCALLLPAVLDTLANRREMQPSPSWTPVSDIADYVLGDLLGTIATANTRVHIKTVHGKTEFSVY